MSAEKKVGDFHEEEKTCLQKTADQWHGFTSFMWDPDNNAVMGRNARSWAEIGLFYLCFYAFLAGFFSSLIAIFYYGFISQEAPTYTDKMGTPGIIHRPRYKNEINIAFNMDNQRTYGKFVDDISNYLKPFRDENQNSSIYQDCQSGTTPEDEFGRLCKFDLSELANCTDPELDSFGYPTGKPCVFLSLNKVWGWQPTAFKNGSVPESFRDVYEFNSVLMECKGKKTRDKENIGDVAYYPTGGLDFKYFPYIGTTDKQSVYRTHYLEPVMAVHFHNLTLDTTVRIECWARAEDLEYGEFEGHVEFMLRVNTALVKIIPEKPVDGMS